jgi:hypothetical protein
MTTADVVVVPAIAALEMLDLMAIGTQQADVVSAIVISVPIQMMNLKNAGFYAPTTAPTGRALANQEGLGCPPTSEVSRQFTSSFVVAREPARRRAVAGVWTTTCQVFASWACALSRWPSRMVRTSLDSTVDRAKPLSNSAGMSPERTSAVRAKCPATFAARFLIADARTELGAFGLFRGERALTLGTLS